MRTVPDPVFCAYCRRLVYNHYILHGKPSCGPCVDDIRLVYLDLEHAERAREGGATSGIGLARVYSRGTDEVPGDLPRDANARLIAAAPDLLERFEALEDAATRYVRHGGAAARNDLHAALNEARAIISAAGGTTVFPAIAKAEGGAA